MTFNAKQSINHALLVLPRLQVQNANAISSPMTWGFPAMSAFIGLMTAIERRLGHDAGINIFGVGVICHSFEPQVSRAGYTRRFSLTRNPLRYTGTPAAIVEEGRVHLNLTLVFDVELASALLEENERVALARHIADLLSGMRIAGGSVTTPAIDVRRRSMYPRLVLIPDDPEERRSHFQRLARGWLPGFALVRRDDLLQERLKELRQIDTAATELDAWLDLSRWNRRAVRRQSLDDKTGQTVETVEWITEQRPGWIVPIPVGFAALSELHAPDTVIGARDTTTPFRFVESVYSLGQWIGPHRLQDAKDFLWYPQYNETLGLYNCHNEFSI